MIIPRDRFLGIAKRVLVPAFRRLPYGVRRAAFRCTCPRRYRMLQESRAHERSSYALKPFDEHQCIFVHIPKTAGVSVAKTLFGTLGGQHTPLWLYQLIFSRAEFAAYFKFAFVRNPWDRVLSSYVFLKEGGMNERDRAWAQRHLCGYGSFDEFVRRWVNRSNVYSELHFVPQAWYLALSDGRPGVDFVGYYENLDRDFEYLRGKLGIAPDRPLPCLNKTQGKDRRYTEYYSPITRQIVESVYREDIELFGYDFDNLSLGRRLASRVSPGAASSPPAPAGTAAPGGGEPGPGQAR